MHLLAGHGLGVMKAIAEAIAVKRAHSVAEGAGISGRASGGRGLDWNQDVICALRGDAPERDKVRQCERTQCVKQCSGILGLVYDVLDDR